MTTDLMLQLVPTERLIRELLARCDHGLIAFMRVAEGAPDEVALTRRWKGNTHVVAGMATDLARIALEEWNASVESSSEPPSPEDEV